MMRTRCPSCGTTVSLDALMGHEAAREALQSAFRLSGRLGALLLQYLGLFRPSQRELTMDRLARLLNDLLPDLHRGRVTRHGREWPAPVDVWIAALDIVIAAPNLRRPLSSHGYLYSVVVGAAERHEADAERLRETQRAYPYSQTRHPDGPQPLAALAAAARPDKTPPPPDVAATLKKFNRKGNDHGKSSEKD